ncbi:hypothetical protein CUMW_080970 [Citrus unshiu]|nr:hypothetical protein CUMW_080970 [Citrus unshiu]
MNTLLEYIHIVATLLTIQCRILKSSQQHGLLYELKRKSSELDPSQKIKYAMYLDSSRNENENKFKVEATQGVPDLWKRDKGVSSKAPIHSLAAGVRSIQSKHHSENPHKKALKNTLAKDQTCCGEKYFLGIDF